MPKIQCEYSGGGTFLTLSNPTNCTVGSNTSYYDDNNIYLSFSVTITTTGTNASVKLPFNVKSVANAVSGYTSSSLVPDYLNSFNIRSDNPDIVLFTAPKSKYIYVQCVVPRD